MNAGNHQTEPTGKGKGKANPLPSTERTPLLASESPSQPPLYNHDPEEESRTHHATHRSLRSKMVLLFLVWLSLCVCVLVLVVVTAYSYVAKASHASPEELLDRGVVVRGPDRVDVLNVTESGGVWVSVEGRVGIDAGAIVGLRSDNLFNTLSSYLARWGIRQLGHITITLGLINVSSGYDKTSSLASIVGPALELPLTAEHTPDDLSWLTRVSVPLLVYPTQNASALAHFARDSWANGVLATDTHVQKVVVQGGKAGESGWRRRLQVQRSDIQLRVCIEIPPLPGLPVPGDDAPLPSIAELITLQSLDISTAPGNISLSAQATFIDPAPLNFNLTSPSMPFIISLPTSPNDSGLDDKPIPLASVHTDPFSLTHPNITVSIFGTLLPVPADASPIFSTFLAAYLEGKPNPIVVSTPLFPDLSVGAIFPPPVPKPKVLRGVTIRDMKIKPSSSGNFLTSGTIYVHAVLPRGMNVGLNITRVLPDVLVFDGEPPLSDELQDAEKDDPDDDDDPDPFPERAFARIAPEEWLDSVAEGEESGDDEGSAYVVSAKFFDVPLQVLPGREKQFRAFLSKVIFGSGGAVAGLLGTVDAAVEVDGLQFEDGRETGREMEVNGLPFRGSVRVRKSTFLRLDILGYFRNHGRT